jgi:SPP1 gp7 family putative phage head morphogenesis protein
MQQALDELPQVTWPERKAFAAVAAVEMLLANLFGRLEVAIRYEGHRLKDWTELPPKDAIEHFKKRARNLMKPAEFKKLADGLKQRAFSVAYLQHDHQLSVVADALTRAIEEGTPRAKFVREMRKKLGDKTLTKAHLETVHSNNILGAYQHGRWKKMTTPSMRRARPFWQYRTVGDGRVRPTHREMDGRIYAQDDPVWATWFPPSGMRCRCTVLPLSRSDVEPGDVETGPPGVEPDEGFATSPADFTGPLDLPTKVLPRKGT